MKRHVLGSALGLAVVLAVGGCARDGGIVLPEADLETDPGVHPALLVWANAAKGKPAPTELVAFHIRFYGDGDDPFDPTAGGIMYECSVNALEDGDGNDLTIRSATSTKILQHEQDAYVMIRTQTVPLGTDLGGLLTLADRGDSGWRITHVGRGRWEAAFLSDKWGGSIDFHVDGVVAPVTVDRLAEDVRDELLNGWPDNPDDADAGLFPSLRNADLRPEEERSPDAAGVGDEFDRLLAESSDPTYAQCDWVVNNPVTPGRPAVVNEILLGGRIPGALKRFLR